MKKSLLLGWIILVSCTLRAQVVLNLQLPPAGLTIKPQLWSLALVNAGEPIQAVRIELVVSDASTGQAVISGVSRIFLLPKGPKQIRLADVMPVLYNAGNAGYAVDPRPDGFLPTGVFNICYSVIRSETDAPEKLSEECETVHIEPLSPPQLIVPADNELLSVNRPVFSWLPPAPVNTGSRVLYDWTLVQVQATQSAADAVQQNIPVLSRQNVSFTSFQFPMAMPALDTGKLYAWRITAKSNGLPIANSETWSFRLAGEKKEAVNTNSGAFTKLQRQEDGAFVVTNGELRFLYENEQNMQTVNITIADISAKVRKPIALETAEYPVQYGSNFMSIDLKKGLINGHRYLLELVDQRQVKWYLQFEYKK